MSRKKKRKGKRSHGRYCAICGCARPNEQFSAKGNTCNRCKRTVSKAERDYIRNSDFLHGMLHRQKNISQGNIETLEKFVQSGHPRLVEQAKVVLEIARVKPGKKRRYKFLWENHRHLLEDLFRAELIYLDDLLGDYAFASLFSDDDGLTADGERMPGSEWEDPEYWAELDEASEEEDASEGEHASEEYLVLEEDWIPEEHYDEEPLDIESDHDDTRIPF